MKKIILSVTAISLLLMLNVVFAKNNPNGAPFTMIWNAINSLQAQLDEIVLLPGEQGLSGEDGEDGVDGANGADGLYSGRVCQDFKIEKMR